MAEVETQGSSRLLTARTGLAMRLKLIEPMLGVGGLEPRHGRIGTEEIREFGRGEERSQVEAGVGIGAQAD